MAYQQEAMQLGDQELRKGTWLEEEDERLISFVQLMGERRWDALAKASGLKRSGKSCRLRWLNYLRPNLKRGQISVEEQNIILELHEKWGNKWSKIARRLPGRTDNEIKNYWRTHLRKGLAQGQEVSGPAGKSQFELEKAKGDFLFHKENESSATKNTSHGSVEDLWGSCSWDNSSEGSGISTADHFALTSSPYENRLSDWISEYSSDIQSEMNYQNDSTISMESASSYNLECWTTPDLYSYAMWDYSDSLWDMN